MTGMKNGSQVALPLARGVGVILLFLVGGRAFADTTPPARGWISIFNQDSSDFTIMHGDEKMNEAGVLEYLDEVIGNGAFTHFFISPNAQIAIFDSKTFSPSWWRFVSTDGKTERPLRAFSPADNCPRRDYMLHTNGVDIVQTYIRGCRAKGVSPWLSMRMNDGHCEGDPEWWGHSRFWVEHPEYRRYGGFNFSHPEVRAHHLAFVRELLDRYDVDGIECDWMRFPIQQRAVDLTETMRGIRQIATAAARRRGHGILVGVRVPTRPDMQLSRGFDPVTWAKEGLFDWLVPCNFHGSVDYDLPLVEWNRILKAVNRNVRVIPGADSGVWTLDEKTGKRSGRRMMTLGEYREWAYRMQSQGAEGVYLFNLFLYREPSYCAPSLEPWHMILKEGLSPAAIRGKERSFPKGWVYEP